MTKVLVVEDEAAIREEIVDMLRLDGYEVVEARDGEVAIAMAREELPDLVISDIMMPNIDGFEFFHILKEDSQTANIPFIFLSALAAYDDVRQGMEMGADDYLTKPFDFNQLMNAVQARLRKHADEEFHRFRQLAGQLINHHDDERAEIARELQERVLASLNGLYMLQESVNDEGGPDQRIWEGQLNAVIRETQAVINRLQPLLLQQLSIDSILQWLALHYEKRHGLQVSLQLPEQALRATAEAQQVIYQVTEEALANCARHAQTAAVRVVVQSLPDACRIEITDRGVGFDLSVLPESVGLLRVREKARLIGAFVRVASAPGHGTRVTLHLPQQALANRPDPAPPKLDASTTPTQDSKKQGVRIVIAEDHEVIAEGLAAVVRSLEGFSVAASVQTTAQLFDAVASHQPEIVIVDAVLERATGLEAVYALKVRWPNIRVIVLAPYDDVVYANELLRQGVNGFLLKKVRRQEIVQALQAVRANRQYVAPELEAGLHALRQPQRAETIDWDHDVLRSLTFREREIFYLVLAGRTSPQIGDTLNISHRTVETHRRNFMKKLGVTNINELHRFAVQHQLMPQE